LVAEVCETENDVVQRTVKTNNKRKGEKTIGTDAQNVNKRSGPTTEHDGRR